MQRLRLFLFLVLPLLTCLALLFTGAVAQQSTSTSQPSKNTGTSPQASPKAAASPTAAAPAAANVPAPPRADPRANETLNEALKLLDPKKLGWIETTLWQQVDLIGFSFQADGRYLAGPDQRLRLDLKVRLGNTDGEMKLVCDGTTYWNLTRIAAEEPMVAKYSLKEIRNTLNSPGTPPQVGDDFLKTQSFQGLQPLLQNLRQQMTFTKQEESRWKGHEVYKLTGVWSTDIAKALTPPSNNPAAPAMWQPFVARSCTLYLDKQAPHWLYRLEWWGPTTPTGSDTQLMQMEFRDPKIQGADSSLAQRYASQFTFDESKYKVQDATRLYLDTLAQMKSSQSSGASRP